MNKVANKVARVIYLNKHLIKIGTKITYVEQNLSYQFLYSYSEVIIF